MMTMDRTMLPVREAAKMLGIHANTFRRWADEGMFPIYRMGKKRVRRVKRADLERFLEQHKQGT